MKINKNEPVLINKNNSAAFFNVSVTAFAKWDVDWVQKKGREVFYDLRELVEYKNGTEPEQGELDLTEERAKLTQEQRKKTALERKIIEGNLLDVEAMIVVLQNQTTAVRAKLLSIPTKLAQELVNIETPIEVQEKIKIQIYEILDELSSNKFTEATGIGVTRIIGKLEALQAAD